MPMDQLHTLWKKTTQYRDKEALPWKLLEVGDTRSKNIGALMLSQRFIGSGCDAVPQ